MTDSPSRNLSISDRTTAVPDSRQRRCCPTCGVHSRICVCSQCRYVTTPYRLWVLQDAAEVGHAKGTLRVAKACLPELEVVVGERNGNFSSLRDGMDLEDTALLFPAAPSRPLEDANTRADVYRNWILLDGTWRKARRIFFANPWLQALPAFHFQAPPESLYRIRKRPAEGNLSTVEAVAHLLSMIDPECDTRPLHQGLGALVEAQLAQMPDEVRERYG